MAGAIIGILFFPAVGRTLEVQPWFSDVYEFIFWKAMPIANFALFKEESLS